MENIGQSAVQADSSSTPSATKTNSIKISMFRAKAGFVIPRNKLSGSLVPTFKGVKKSKGSDTANEESIKQSQRKTRWGEDLTQEASVRRGRALAYQTRVEQIPRQLKAGSLGIEDDQDDTLSRNVTDNELSSHQTDSQEKLKYLELEKREAIGEILKLNPSFKAPSDYKPLMKEECIPLPVKEHPGYNFVGLFYGPGGDTQKRLEKETGVRTQVYGAKSKAGEKVVIKASDGGQVSNSYEEMHVQLSADSYEKIDTAIALIELLVSSVRGKSAVPSTSTLASGDDVSKAENATSAPLSSLAMQNQETEPPGLVTLQNAQGQFQLYGAPWMSPASPHTSYTPLPAASFSSPVSNPVYPSSYPFNSSSMSSPFGTRFDPPSGFRPAPPTMLNVSPMPSMQSFQRPFMPGVQPLGQIGSLNLQNHPPHSSSFQYNNSGTAQFMGHQLPAGAASHHMNANMSLGAQNVPPILPSTFQASAPMVSGAPVPPLGSSSASPNIPRPLYGPPFSPQVHSSSGLSVQQFAPHGPVPNLTVHPPQSGMQNSGFSAIRSPSFTPLNSMTGVSPRPPLPSSADFTFQPRRPPAMPPPAHNHGPGNHFPSHGGGASLMPPPPSPGAPPFRQMMQSSSPPSVHPWLPFSNQMGQHSPVGSRYPGPAPTNTGTHYPPRAGPGRTTQFQPNMRPGNVFPPNQGLRGGNIMFGAAGPSITPSPVGQQGYDPFSPTSVSASPQVQGSNRAMTTKQDDDPEYEDLMASVGVE
ncbi:Splicing factor-like protein [Drosera capensis]